MTTNSVAPTAEGRAAEKGTTKSKEKGAVTPALTGAPSPYALAELATGRAVDWSAVSDRVSVLEEIFDTPYSELISAADSPLFYGSNFRDDGTVVRERPFRTPHDVRDNDAEREDAGLPDVASARTLAELVSALDDPSLEDVPVRGAAFSKGRLVAELGETDSLRDRRLARFFDERLLDVLFPVERGYHPPGFSWQDTGRFFDETAEFFDPVQGQVGDCYLIAALASVAWASPHTISDRTRAIGPGQDAFTHRISFFRDGGWQSVEVSDRVLVANGGSQGYYARSAEPGEIWPGVYEKAFAKWRFGTSDDFPQIPDLAWGDPVGAAVNITGGSGYYRWHSSFTASQILTTIKSHSVSGRTTTPMVAWSHGGGSPEATTAASEAGIVASHAYSVLGWLRRTEWVRRHRFDLHAPLRIPELDLAVPRPEPGPLPVAGPAVGGLAGPEIVRPDRLIDSILDQWVPVSVDYVVLRNPWGFAEGTGSSTATGGYTARDVDWWRTTTLGQGGTFALEIGAYHRYFAGTGGAD
jgi:hypothetical protein